MGFAGMMQQAVCENLVANLPQGLETDNEAVSYLPSESEIKAMCRLIQPEWSRDTEFSRRVSKRGGGPWTPPTVRPAVDGTLADVWAGE
jgi:hypothetical protein